jgi:hypothetical protein
MSEDYTYPPIRLPGNELAYTVHVIERTQLRPGDLLVLTTPVFLTDEMVATMTARMRGLVPSGVRVAVMDGGLTIGGIIGAQDGRE